MKDNKAPQTNKNNNAKSAAYVSSSSSLGPWGSGTNIPPQPPKNQSGNSSLKFIGVVAIFLIFGLFLYNNSQENDYASNNSSNISQTNNTTSYCNHNPRQCNNSELCKKATLGDKWEVRDDFRAYVNLAKQKGLTCGVSQYSNNNSDCSTEPTKCNNTELCKKATLRDEWEIRDHFKGYVSLAKQKGLSCGVIQSKKYSDLSDYHICEEATLFGEWQTKAYYIPFVREAKNRGLSCGVNTYSRNNSQINNQTNSNGGDCTSNASKCRNTELCEKATLDGDWEVRSYYKDHVSLAKQRGLTCGVKIQNNKNVRTINFTGSWVNYKCAIKKQKRIGSDSYFFYFVRQKEKTQLFIGIDNKPFQFGDSADLQVDRYKKLPNSPINYSFWTSKNSKDIFGIIDITYNSSFLEQLKSGYDLVVVNNFKKIKVDLMGFSSAYNLLSSKNSCD